MVRARWLKRPPRLFRLPHCGAFEFAVMVADATDLVFFASAVEAVKPSEASVSASASNFFILFPFLKKNQVEQHPRHSRQRESSTSH